MAVYEAMKRLHEMGLEPLKVEAHEHIDCFCGGKDCNVVRGTFVIIVRLKDGRLALFTYWSHTQTDCDVAGIPLSECDVDSLDAESLEFRGVYKNWREIYESVCPRYGGDDP